MSYRSPYSEDELRVEQGTKPREVREFALRRAINPHVFGEKIVWNFNNHKIMEDSLVDQLDELKNDEYLIPYQASGVWGVIFGMLPERIREAEILSWSQRNGKYFAFPNYYRHSENGSSEQVQNEIERYLESEGL